MKQHIQYFSQNEYARILDNANAREINYSQSRCEQILMDAGASYEQAKNGAYVYLHHGSHTIATKRATQTEYDKILKNYKAQERSPQDCIRHLEKLGFSYGQTKSAVYKFRLKNKLIRK